MESKVISRIQIKKYAFPLLGGYNYSVEVYRSVDDGKTFYFCGTQKPAKNITDAKKIRKELAKKEQCVI